MKQHKIFFKGTLGTLFQQVVSFGIIGVINTLMGFLLIELFYNVFQWNYWISSMTSYTIGSIYSFFANKKLTFKIRGNTRKTGVRFLINTVICYGIAYGIAKPLVRVTLADMSQKAIENVALIVGMGFFIVLNFFGQKFYVFSEQKTCDKDTVGDGEENDGEQKK